ncbi:uncharacterized protein LOC143357362 isoform X2 [Halictus rubicundus]|uniref:uncharacterized protein LOC143357362 isoform X2 n=1 Tax=Halictus rubicundus TaxID=77578 RepID=UPI0040366DF1
MEANSYVSCIKINGVPILPPLMTKDIKEEMFNYKQIAIRVEKKLATLRVDREQNKDIDAGIDQKNRRNILNNSREDPFLLDCNKCQNKTETITNGFSPELHEDYNEDVKKDSQWNGETNVDRMPEYQISLSPDAYLSSGVVPPKTNTDQFNKISSAKSTTIETVSNVWKPQVPTTLNIIPMTLNNPNCREDEIYNKSDLHDAGDTPKLVRQGSYVLDTPSPVLLAHMQMEHNTDAKPCTEYVPTSCSNKGHRKEWNILQAKIEWENCKSKSFVRTVPAESFELSPDKNRNSDSKFGQRMHKSVSSLTIPAPLFATYPATRSVDCIQTMLANEYIEKPNIEANCDRKYATRNSNEKRQDFQGSKKNNNFSTFQLAHKRGIVPVRAASSDSGVPFSSNLVHEHNKVPINDNCADEMSRNIETEDFASKLKLTVTSDKVLTVYKKVQEMHKNQMTELVTRQQREQTLLQEEFEKQQLLLLTEIRKSFPEISVSLLSENILPTSFNQATLDSGKLSTDIGSNMETMKNLKSNVQDERRVEHSRNDNKKLMPCPLDNTYSEISLPAMESCFMGKEEVKTELQPDKDRSYEKVLVKDGGGGCKRLNVSRQLFPLDSKTVHIPILDRTVYGSKHIEAVNLINAYTRGYLVRRMMRTERVIALKNTYREALHCMLKLHVDAPLNRSESNFLYRLQLQCDAASMNIVELFAHKPEKRMQVIAQDREIKQSRTERPTSARSYSFATQRTLARKKLKEIEERQPSSFARSCLSRSRCQTWTSDDKEKILSPNILYHDIKRSTSAGTVRKPWR